MTLSHDLWFEIFEIDDCLLMVEANDVGGPPVISLTLHDDQEPWVFNWGTRRYERAASVTIR